MANTIKIKRSSVADAVPAAVDLEIYELAMNIVDGRLFSKNSAGAIIELAPEETPTQVLTKIKTVDGAGSGLDSDLLDGLDSLQFLRSDVADVKTAGHLKFSDNVHASFGDDADFSIYWDGTNYKVKGYADGAPFWIEADNAAGLAKSLFHADPDGAATIYHKGVGHIQTTNTGIFVAGDITATDLHGSADDAKLLDGLDSTQFLRSDQSDTMTGTLTLTGDVDASGDLIFGASNLNLSEAGGGQGRFTSASATYSRISFATDDNAVRGYIGYDSGGYFGINDSNDLAAIAHYTDSHTDFLDAGEKMFSVGVGGITGQYGTVQTKGAGKGGYEGYATTAGAVFMAQSPTMGQYGLFDDNNNQWSLRAVPNGETALRFAGVEKLATTVGGISVTGDVTATNFIGSADDAKLLDGLDSTQFLRSDQSDTMTGDLTVTGTVDANALTFGSTNWTLAQTDTNRSALYGAGNSYNIVELRLDNGTKTGLLWAEGNGNIFGLKSGNEEWMLRGVQDSYVSLYYDNAVKLQTSATGISVTGDVDASGDLKFGTGAWQLGEIDTLDAALRSDSASGVGLALQYNSGVTQGWLYANASGFGLLDGDRNFAIKHVKDSHTDFLDNNEPMFSVGVGGVTGDYGTVQVKGSGKGGWQGYAIDGDAVYMSNGTYQGLYDDTNNQWGFRHYHGAQAELFYNGAKKLETNNGGATVTGNLIVNGPLDLPDNQALRLGDSDDFLAYHSGTAAYFKSQNHGGWTYFQGEDTGGTNRAMLYMDPDGSVTAYYAGAAKFATVATGITVVGEVEGDTLSISGDATIDGELFVGRTVTDIGSLVFSNDAARFSSRGITNHEDPESTVMRLMRDGQPGIIYAGNAQFDLSRWEDSGTASRTQLSIKLSHATPGIADGEPLKLRSDGTAHIGTDLFVTNDATIYGNLTVQGSTTAVNTADLDVEDNNITLNKGETGAGVSAGSAGIIIDRGTLADALILFDEISDKLTFSRDNGTTTYTILTTEDEGAGNGMDADTVDGYHAGNLLKSNEADTADERITFAKGVSFGSQVGASNLDLSKHINLWGTSYGFNITSNTLNIVSGNNGSGSIVDVMASSLRNRGVEVALVTDKAPDSELLDGINSTQFLRSDAPDTTTAHLTGSSGIRATGGLTDPRVNFQVWSDGIYGMGMKAGMSYGELNDYAMTFQMAGGTGSRGWWWGTTGHSDAQGSMSLNTEGDLTLAGDLHVNGWTYLNVAGTNVVLESDLVERGVFDFRQNDVGKWLLRIEADADLNWESLGAYNMRIDGDRILTEADLGNLNDADTLDGLDSTQFLRSDTDDTYTGNLTGGELVQGLHPTHAGYYGLWNTERFTANVQNYMIISAGDGTYINGAEVYLRPGANNSGDELRVATGTSGLTFRGGQVWHSQNDGAGSGLDADTIDGLDSTQFLRSDASDTMSGNLEFNTTGNTQRSVRFKGTDELGMYSQDNVLGLYDWTTAKHFLYAAQSGAVSLYYSGAAKIATNPTGVTVTGTVTATTFAGNATSASDAALLDGIDSTGFLRSDTSDAFTSGTMTFNAGTHLKMFGGLYFEHTGNAGYVPHPVGGQYRGNGSETGAIKIQLPTYATADMMSFWVDIYDYANDEMFSLMLGGYVYQAEGSDEWVNVSAMNLNTLVSRDVTVRFGVEANKHCIWIGETNTNWTWLGVVVRDFQGTYTTDIDAYDDGWAITIATAFGTVDETRSSNMVQAKHATTAGDADTLDGLSSSQFVRSDTADTVSGITTFNDGIAIGAPPVNAAITDMVAADSAIDIAERNTAGGGFVSALHQRTTITGGYRKHVDIGTYRTTGWNGGIYFGQGGNDSYPTEYFLMNHGGSLTHSLGHTFWHSDNDGAGSGLDADLLDGQQGSYYAAASHNHNATYLGISAKAADSNLLDGKDSSAFVERNVGQYWTGTGGNALSFHSGVSISTTDTAALEVYQDTVGDDAYMAFHTAGDYAVHFGLDGGTNKLSVGGWSLGGNSYQIWHAGNDGAGSTLDADLLDGQQGSYYLAATAKAADSELLDGLDSTAFLRSNAADTLTGTLSVQSDIVVTDAARDHGMFGFYNPAKTQHIWSMGVAYKNNAAGTNFGNLYGAAYKHTNNTTGGTMAGGHQFVWCENGVGKSALGTNIWTSGSVTAASAAITGAITGASLDVSGTVTFGANNWVLGQVNDDDAYLRSGDATVASLALRASDNVTRGYFYATTANLVGILDSDRNWAIKHTRDSHTDFLDNNETMFSVGVGGVTGDYGTVQVKGTGKGSWDGYSIEGAHVFMAAGANCGLYNDTNNEWYLYASQNAAIDLRYNGLIKFATTSGGVAVTGALTTTTTATIGTDLTVSGGDIILSGTGRIQGIDTVSATTDAASKGYVDTAVAGVGYTHPTHAGDDINVDTGALTGATVVSDIDINITTDTLGHVTDANGVVSTRTLTLANLGYTGETNATADQTAAEILTAIKTVDGAGSGLDADLLDGVSSASFLRSDTSDTATGSITFNNTAIHNDFLRMNDGYDIRLGTGNDFRMDHNGTDTLFRSYLHGSVWKLQCEETGGTNRNMIWADPDVGVTLYQGLGSTARLQTNTTGVAVTGALTTTTTATIGTDLTVSGGDITLGGTGRIQGVDTVTADTDAASKGYVDTEVAAVTSNVPSHTKIVSFGSQNGHMGRRSMVLSEDGTLWSWGINDYGQLGTFGYTTAHAARNSPMQVRFQPGEKVVSFSASRYTSAAITEGVGGERYLWTWGYNANGQLGTGNTTSYGKPNYIDTSSWDGDPDEVFVICSYGAATVTFVITTTGKLYGCGYNTNGGLGIGNNTATITTFTQATGLVGSVTAVSGCGYTNYIVVGGTWQAAGYNQYGELGRNNTTQANTFANVQDSTGAAISGITKLECTSSSYITTGYCLTTTNKLYTVGHNGDYQCGTGNTTAQTRAYNVANTVGDFQSTHGRYGSTMYMTTAGALYGFGRNYHGELGRGNTTQVTTPTALTKGGSAITGVDAIYGSGGCSNTPNFWYWRDEDGTDGQLWGAGMNAWRSLGVGWTSGVVNAFSSCYIPAKPLDMRGHYVWTGSNNIDHTVALLADGRLYSCGHSGQGQLGYGYAQGDTGMFNQVGFPA